MTERIPAEAFHPSEYILDEIEARGWTKDELISRLEKERGFKSAVFDLYLGGSPGIEIGADGSARLGRVFGVHPDFFLNLERAWLKWKAAQSGS